MTSSCNNSQEKEKAAVGDSVDIARDIEQEDSTLIFENNTDKWLDLSLNNTIGSWQKFRLKEFWYDDSMRKQPFSPAPGFYRDYAPLLRWSPDSSYILDVGSYGKVLIKDKEGNIKIEDGEVDTKTSLIFPKKNSSAELIFLGAAGSIIDGHWIDSTQFSLLGTFDQKGDQHPDTLLWIIDAKEKFFRKYKWE
ncbi:MAG: hypothetical protein ABI861_09000 [Panacibacter sp.]